MGLSPLYGLGVLSTLRASPAALTFKHEKAEPDEPDEEEKPEGEQEEASLDPRIDLTDSQPPSKPNDEVVKEGP